MNPDPILKDDALEWCDIIIRGAGAPSFAQGQFTQNLGDCGAEGLPSALLAPDSAVVSAGILRHGEGEVRYVLPASLVEASMVRLKRFMLRSACELDVETATAGPYQRYEELLLSGWPSAFEIGLGLPPHSYGASFVHQTISFTKGCYTGQELVGRLDVRGGNVPWRVVQFEGSSLHDVEAVLRSKGPAGPQGATSAFWKAERLVGLGVAHRTLIGNDEEVLAGVMIRAL